MGRLLPSSFDTYPLGLLGVNGQAIVVAGADDRPRRVVLEPFGVAGRVFVATAPQVLDTPGTTIPARGYLLTGGPEVIPIGPKQALYASAENAGSFLSVAINDALVATYKPSDLEGQLERLRPTALSISALRLEKVPIVEKGKRPKRVVISAIVEGNALVRVGRSPTNSSPEYTIPSTGPRVFVLAPGQDLYVRATEAVGFVSTAVSEIPYGALTGPTGIPGPDGQE